MQFIGLARRMCFALLTTTPCFELELQQLMRTGERFRLVEAHEYDCHLAETGEDYSCVAKFFNVSIATSVSWLAKKRPSL